MKTQSKYLLFGLWVLLITHSAFADCQTIYQYRQDDATICFFNRDQSQYIPFLMRRYQRSRALHSQIWGELPEQAPFMMLSDWEDDGNGGVAAMPHTLIQIGMAPLNMSYYISPSNERYDHLFKHELTHVIMDDKTNRVDRGWRAFTGTKVVPNSEYPVSALWSYFNTPRWYCPRWYHEGIACFMETWLADGAGRSLGGYDETYFRTQIKEGRQLFSIVGLETEGSTTDFQQGATSYLYGTRFVNYLTLKYGFDNLVRFYNRTEDSRTSYIRQFKDVYGSSLRQVWSDWQEYEKEHQEENLEKIAEYPLTQVNGFTSLPVGGMSPMIIDEERRVAYAATNHKGDLAQIVELQLDSDAKPRRLAYVEDPAMYQISYLAYDKKGGRLFWTERNSKMRSLVVYDLAKKKITKELKYHRVYDLCYDNVRGGLYALMSNGGVIHLVKYDPSLEKREVLYSFPFGVSVSDLDVSHDGKNIVVAVLGTKGQQSLVMFSVDDLEDNSPTSQTLYTLYDSNLTQYRFSADDSRLVGTSYYTGVANIWEYDMATGDFNLLSNTQTGLYAPYLAANDTIYALESHSEGMSPVVFERQVLSDANSVGFLGQKAYNANPDIAELSTLKDEFPDISFGQVYDSIKVYSPFKEIRFQGAYPDISGFVDRKAWNNVTPVLGYHFAFYDPLSLFSINLVLGASPWSNNAWKNRFHASADIKYYNWQLNAAWNPTCFYDLFGPRRASRKGYNVSLSYNRRRSMQPPFSIDWGAAVAHYGDMDALPLYQDIGVQEGITSFQTANAYFNVGKSLASMGAVTAEQGYSVLVNAYTYLAEGKFFPSLDISGNLGFLLPVGQHNSFWIKACAGQSFGDRGSVFGNSYFGGFRNNYVDNGAVNRYRTLNAMPGAYIDQISAHNYAKFTGEINFCPIRFNNFGALQCYPNYIQFNVFANDLMTDRWGNGYIENRRNYISTGSQVNIQLVLFSSLKTTLSFGYARVWGGGLNRGEFMASLKLL